MDRDLWKKFNIILTKLLNEGFLLLYACSLGTSGRFIGLDHYFREMARAFYDRWLRWIYAISPLLGWGLGSQFHLSGFAKAVCFAVLSRAILINTIKEEVPVDEKASFAAFCVGIVLITTVVFFLDSF